MKTKNLIINRIIICFLCLMVFIGSILSLNVSKASAEDSITFDDTNVLDDLRGSTIGGKEFNEADYPLDNKGRLTLINFSEFCYSAYANNMDDYALYVYLYNPQGLAFDDSKNNTIAFSTGDNDYQVSYDLQFLNCSQEENGVLGRFLKYKVVLTDSKKQNLLNKLSSTKRIYKISEIQLAVNGIISNYPIVSYYSYTGYAKGYGTDYMTESTLNCKVDGFDTYLQLDVESTYYRPKGFSGDKITSDTLHSVYFGVKKNIVNEYGPMSSARATYYDALLSPALATGDEEAYSAIYAYLGRDIGRFTKDLKHAYVSDPLFTTVGTANGNSSSFISGGSFMYNIWCNDSYKSDYISSLNLLFDVSDEDLSQESVEVISAEEIKLKLDTLTNLYGDRNVLGRYSDKLFEKVAENPTLINVTKEFVIDMNTNEKSTLDLTAKQINREWWDILGLFEEVEEIKSETFNDIPPLEEFDYNDLALSNTDLSKKYFIALSDIPDFRIYCADSIAKNKIVYLFRYRISSYVSSTAIHYEYTNGLLGYPGNTTGDSYSDKNAFFFQMNCDLNFEILDATFTKDNVDTVIPVLMAPMDVFHGATGPVSSDKDGDCTGFDLSKIIAIICFIALMWVLVKTGILGYIVDGIVWLIKAPFKLIAKLFKKDKRK